MPAPTEAGRRLALIVATSEYSDPTLQRLRAPGHDARDLAEVLAEPRIGRFEVSTLIDAPSGQLMRGVAQFCADAGPTDLLLLYLSCHGVLDDRGRLYYATISTERSLLAATAVSAQWLNEQLEDCRSRRQVLVLDCCHSGAFAKDAKGDSALALQDRFSGRGKIVLTASRSTEYSFEGADVIGQGVRSVFTHVFVEGLRTGDADRDKDGLISITDLYQHVYDRVRASERRQTPELWTYGAEGDLLIAFSPRGAVLEPAPLPEDLRIILENPRLAVREAAIRELAELLDHGQAALALTAKQTLERIAAQDHPRIGVLARAAVDAASGHAFPAVEAAQRGRDEADEQARREATELARQREAERRQQIATQQDRLRQLAKAHRWSEVLDVSEELARVNPAAADPDGLATAAREQLARQQEAERAEANSLPTADQGSTLLRSEGQQARGIVLPDAPMQRSTRGGVWKLAGGLAVVAFATIIGVTLFVNGGRDATVVPGGSVSSESNATSGTGTNQNTVTPVSSAKVALAYNLAGVEKLNLRPTVIAAIFSGKVTKWTDPAIRKDNQATKLPPTDISAFHVIGSSGITERFTQFLDAAGGSAWGYGSGKLWRAPSGQGAAGTEGEGVAAAIRVTLGAIGYMDPSVANNAGLRTATVIGGLR